MKYTYSKPCFGLKKLPKEVQENGASQLPIPSLIVSALRVQAWYSEWVKFAYLGCHLLEAQSSITPLDVIARHSDRWRACVDSGFGRARKMSSMVKKISNLMPYVLDLWISSSSEKPFSRRAFVPLLQWLNISHFRSNALCCETRVKRARATRSHVHLTARSQWLKAERWFLYLVICFILKYMYYYKVFIFVKPLSNLQK